MKVVREEESRGFRLDRSVVTVGAFDGIHLGHRVLLEAARERARELGVPSVAVSFDRHPLAVLAPERVPKLLMSPAMRDEVLEEAGVDYLYLLHFDHARASQTAEEFARSTLCATLGAAVVVVGENFTFGARGAGTPAVLVALGKEMGFEAVALELTKVGAVGGIAGFADSEPISATLIRLLIQEGRLPEAEVLLGRPFAMEGAVASGDQRGRQLGFPTANVMVPPSFVKPPDGVYAGRTVIGGEERLVALSLGTRPMYYPDGGLRLLEAHVLDFGGDLYGTVMRVEFAARIREQRVFDDESELLLQIEADVGEVRRLLLPE